ncbi:TetR/AcrR family transcriptional regulator [Agrococcus sp. ARC_14]|uniref:TetR/AcrR family transcriptional regulator n=1 Tax=Agrococcus sp. ARC_14 TaxID=2919927 RepID=UPI001F064883|nr:TetR/AcrR family transcriptional regulator [Agrococcus sp. ARC_14]MCH1881615.1 TetR/AcrR family transcriptional regulator [Agrococcus sp. ARC_14]
MATTRAPRVGIEERRPQILIAGLTEFSHKGLHGSSTVTIAAEVGISQPNLFRIFRTKRDLFVAVLEEAFAKIAREMLTLGAQDPGAPLDTMSDAWGLLMEDRELMLMVLQGYAASSDAVIRDRMQRWTGETFETLESMRGVTTDIAHDFFADGMLYMIAASIDLPARADQEPWAKRFLDSGS